MLNYKINVLEELKRKGYTTYKIRAEKLISERALQNIRTQSPIAWDTLDKLCTLLNCQPNDIIEHTKE